MISTNFMNATIRRFAIRWRIALLTLVAWTATTACYKWEPVGEPGSAAAIEELDTEDDLRIALADGRIIVLRDRIQIARDSLVGFAHPPERGASYPTGRRAVALSEIRSVERKHARTGSTVLLVGGIVLATAMVIGTARVMSTDLGFSAGG